MSVPLEVYPVALKETSATPAARPDSVVRSRRATDDEILGLVPAPEPAKLEKSRLDLESAVQPADSAHENEAQAGSYLAQNLSEQGPPENLRAALEENPELRAAWHDAQEYRKTFATPEAARQATALLADLDRMDALFFSHKTEDHAELARQVAELDPMAFASFARAISAMTNNSQKPPATKADARPEPNGPAETNLNRDANRESRAQVVQDPSPGQEARLLFFHATNAAAVEGVVQAIESQVDRLLPEGISKSARNRVVGEIYRELDASLRSNRQLAQQLQESLRSGQLDADHQRAVVSLVTSRARQALPGVAKRVLNEWTSTLVAANREQRARQRTAERRVDIAGSGANAGGARRPLAPRDIDYSKMSDGDILNM